MGWADRIGGGPARVEDWVKARTARLVEADAYMQENRAWTLALSPRDRRAIALWVERGGPRPWEAQAAAGPAEGGPQAYPPAQPR